MTGFATAAAAMAVILSAIVRLIRTDASWKAVDEGYAGADHVRDLTGILERGALQDVFGPPTLDGVYRVDRQSILDARRITGWLMGDMRLDLLSMGLALQQLLWTPFGALGAALDALFLGVLAYQAAGWIAAGLMLGRR